MPIPDPQTPKFSAGQCVITTQARQLLPPAEVQQALQRHLRGDWGECDPDDAAANDRAVREGERLLSVYHTADRVRFWIITEADRSATTVLLPDDY